MSKGDLDGRAFPTWKMLSWGWEYLYLYIHPFLPSIRFQSDSYLLQIASSPNPDTFDDDDDDIDRVKPYRMQG